MGVGSNLIQEALWGAFLGGNGRRDYLAYPDLGQSESAGGTDHTPPLADASNIKPVLCHSNWMTNTLQEGGGGGGGGW